MARMLRQSTSRVVRIGPVVAVGDGFTPVTTLSLASADEAEALRDNTATLDISGATFAAITGADGYYSLTLSTTATNTVGELVVVINDDSLCLPVRETFQVVEEAIYDALFAASATGLLPANVTQFGGSNGTFASGRPEVNTTHAAGTAWGSGAITAGSIATGALTAAKFAAGAFDAVWSVTARILTAATNITSTGGTTVPQTGDSYARLGAPAGASVSADVAAVKTDTGNLVTRITSTLFTGITSLAEWLGLLAGKQTGDTTARTELRATGAGSGTFDETADSLEAVRDRGDAAWTTGAGGSAPTVEEIRAEMDANSTQLAAIVEDTGTTLPGVLGSPAGASMSADIAAAKVVADAIQAKTDNLPSDPADQSLIIAATNALSTLLGTPAGASVSADIAAAKVIVDAIKAVTDVLPDSGALTSLAQASALATTDGKVDSVKAVTDNLPDSGALSSLAQGAALTTVDTVVDAIKVVTDALGATAAARLALSAGQMIPGTVDSTATTPTTTVFEADDITEATADHYIGRVIVFTSGALAGQATTITDYALNGGRGQFTTDTLTEAPADDTTFLIV